MLTVRRGRVGPGGATGSGRGSTSTPGGSPRPHARPPRRSPGLLAVAIVLALLVVSSPLTAQEPPVPDVSPGDVVTIPVRLDVASATAPTASYVLAPAERVQPFTPMEGELRPEDGGYTLPVTLALPKSIGAGVRTVAGLAVRVPGEPTRRLDLRVRVAGRHGLRLGPEELERRVTAGGDLRLPLSLENTGNVSDTVRISTRDGQGREWPVLLGNRTLALGPGVTRQLDLTLEVPGDVRVGERLRLEVRAETPRAADRLTVDVWIAEDEGLIGGLEQLPGTLFLGTGTGGLGTRSAGDVFARFRGETVIGAETELEVEARRAPDRGGSPPGFGAAMSGRDLLVRLRRPGWSGGVGDVSTGMDPLAGYLVGGEGGRFRLGETGSALELVATRPESGFRTSGHSVLLGGDLTTGAGTLGFRAQHSALERGGLGQDAAVRSAGVRYAIEGGGPHRLEAEAGVMGVRGPSGQWTTGPAAELEYSLYRPEMTARVEARRVTSRATGLSPRENQVSAHVTRRVVRDLRAFARGFWTSSPRVDLAETPVTRGGSGGLRWSGLGLEATGKLRVREFVNTGGLAGGDRRETTGVLSVRGPLGPVSLGGRAELGTEDFGALSVPSHLLAADARWSSASAFASLGLRYEDDPSLDTGFDVDVRGGWETERVALEGAVQLDTERARAGVVRALTHARYRIDRKTSVVAGMERRPAPFRGTELSFSLGVERKLNLPLPVPTVPLVSGAVFEDRNGNGRRDPGEPGVQGVRFGKGPVTVRTDRNGAYEITDRAARGGRLEMDRTTLPGALMVPTAVEPAAGGGVPVVQPGRVSLRIVEDADANGRADPGEVPVAGAVVQLADDGGRTRTAETGSGGRIRLSGLSPGRYRVSVYVPPEGLRLETQRELEITVGWGETVERDVPLEIRRKTIRFDVTDGS